MTSVANRPLTVLLPPSTALAKGDTFTMQNDTGANIQATVGGTGTLSATVKVWGSLDGLNFVPLATITLSSATTLTDGFHMRKQWYYLYVEVTAISGTNAAVTVTMQT